MSLNMKMNILIVDDSGTMRMMFKQYMTKAGFENFVMAVDGEDAIQKLSENQIDLIISDWNMPNMDGLELLKWVRQDEKCKNIPFLMATAQGDKAQQELVKTEKGNGHIAKPFDSDQIKKKIEEIFGIKQASDEETVERKFVNGKVVMRIGHIQITDHLALGVLKHKIQTGEITPKYFELETMRMPGWNPIQDHLEKGNIDGAFVLAPIAMDLFAFDVPIKLVMLAHKNGSGFVRSMNYDKTVYDSLKSFYKYKVVDIPHKMSVHNMLAYKFLKDLGLKPGVPGKKAIDVRFEVVPPIKMPSIMKENEDVAGFMVAEPICTNAIAKGIGQMEFASSSLWDNHPCCVAAFREEFINEYTDAVYEFSSLIVEAGKMISEDKEKASEIAVNFLDPEKTIGLTTAVLYKVLSEPKGIRMDDLYPVLEDLDKIQRYMHDEMGIGKIIDLEKFVDLRFAKEACKP
ncbi:MAG: ABC transporter substrate-binding protein [Proteobacteria bacterium]|nr:ABC transporter substrate-binding protein [Pseudomonadota bacterium]